MTTNMRSALLWAGLISLIFTLGCGDGPDHIVDGGPCQNTPWMCPDDSGTGDGNVCIPTGNEADNCTDGIDNDCNGDIDTGDDACGGTCPGFMVENTLELCTDGIDNDCNGSRDNTMPGMDPNCEPMSCTPGLQPGPDPLEGNHFPDECFEGGTWPNDQIPNSSITWAEAMNSGKIWSCCQTDMPGLCFNSGMGYAPPVNEGYEPSATFEGGGYALGNNLDLVQYVDSGTHFRFTFEPDASSGTFVRTIEGVTTTYTCL